MENWQIEAMEFQQAPTTKAIRAVSPHCPFSILCFSIKHGEEERQETSDVGQWNLYVSTPVH